MKESRVKWSAASSKMVLSCFLGALLVLVTGTADTVGQTKSFGESLPQFSKAFLPDTIGPGSVTTLKFDIDNTFVSNPVSDLAFTDVLPAGIVIATPASASTSCGGGSVLSAPDGGTTISLSGGTLGAFSACSVSVNVVSTMTATNVSGDLTSSAGNSGPASATLTVDTGRPGFSKSFSPGSIPLGGTSTLTFTIDNTANASNVINFNFTDNLPDGMVIATLPNIVTTCGDPLIPPSITASPGSGSISVNAGGIAMFPALSSGATCTVSVDVTTNSTGVFNNNSDELTSNNGNVSSGFATAVLDVPVDFLTKVFTDDPVAPGGSVTLQFTIQNPSRDFAATGIGFTDDLNAVLPGTPDLTANLPPTPDPPCGAGSTLTAPGNVLTLTGGNLPAEGSCTFSVTLTVPASAPLGDYTNTTSAITATIDGDGVTGNMATDILTVSPAPKLTKLFVGDPVGAGDTVTLRFTIDNTSTTSGATDITFFDELTDGSGGSPPDPTSGFLPFPVSVTLPPVPDPPCGAGSSLALINFDTDRQRLELTGGNLAAAGMAGDSCTFEVTVTIPGGFPGGTYLNTTEVISATVDGATRTGRAASDDVVVVGAPTLLKEFTDDPVDPGSTVTLEFTLSHDEFAGGDATNIAFSDDLAATLAGLTATGATTNTCGGMAAGFPTTNFQYSGGSLTPGSSCTIVLTLSVPAGAAGGNYTNTTSDVTATVLGVATTGNPAEDVLVISGVVLTKEFINDPVVAGGTTTLRFTLENQHPGDDATAIFFTDDLASVLPNPGPDLTVSGGLPLSACGGTLDGFPSGNATSLFFSGGSLNAGDPPCSFDVTVNVPAGAADGTYNNVTSAVSATLGGNGFTGDPATDILTIDSSLLQLTKEFTNDPVAPGGSVELKFVLTNLDSAQAASSVGFTDNLNATLSGLTFDSVVSNTCGAGTVSGTGTTSVTVSGVSLAASGSCEIRLSLIVPGGTPPNSVHTNTTSQVTGTIGGLSVTGDPGTDNLSIGFADNIAPVVSYPLIPNTNSTVNPTLNVTVTDAVGVDRTTVFFRINGGPFTSNACTLSSGTLQNGVWDCPITGMLSNPSAISYYVSAQDFAPNIGSSPTLGMGAPNLYTIGPGIIPAGTYTNLSLSPGTTFGGDVTVLGVLTIGGIVGTDFVPPPASGKTLGTINPTLTLGCNATIVGGGPSNYILGNLAKQFCAPGLFTYPVGTTADGSLRSLGGPLSEYSPFTANVTAVGSVPSTLTVSVVDGYLQGTSRTQSSSRYWNVTETGDLTADISFTYLDQDVVGDEGSYNVVRQGNAFPEVYPGGMVNAATNTATAPGVSAFSRWVAGNLGPTAAPVSIGGRVVTPTGRGISGASIQLTDSIGNIVTRRTNSFGYYRFADVAVGETYFLLVRHKVYAFDPTPRVLTVDEENLGIDIVSTGLLSPGKDPKSKP